MKYAHVSLPLLPDMSPSKSSMQRCEKNNIPILTCSSTLTLSKSIIVFVPVLYARHNVSASFNDSNKELENVQIYVHT